MAWCCRLTVHCAVYFHVFRVFDAASPWSPALQSTRQSSGPCLALSPAARRSAWRCNGCWKVSRRAGLACSGMSKALHGPQANHAYLPHSPASPCFAGNTANKLLARELGLLAPLVGLLRTALDAQGSEVLDDMEQVGTGSLGPCLGQRLQLLECLRLHTIMCYVMCEKSRLGKGHMACRFWMTWSRWGQVSSRSYSASSNVFSHTATQVTVGALDVLASCVAGSRGNAEGLVAEGGLRLLQDLMLKVGCSATHDEVQTLDAWPYAPGGLMDWAHGPPDARTLSRNRPPTNPHHRRRMCAPCRTRPAQGCWPPLRAATASWWRAASRQRWRSWARVCCLTSSAAQSRAQGRPLRNVGGASGLIWLRCSHHRRAVPLGLFINCMQPAGLSCGAQTQPVHPSIHLFPHNSPLAPPIPPPPHTQAWCTHAASCCAPTPQARPRWWRQGCCPCWSRCCS